MAGRVRSILLRTGGAVAILLVLSVVVFDLVFSWFGPPANEWLAAIWFTYIFAGNLGFLFVGAYAAGYIGPFHRRGRNQT